MAVSKNDLVVGPLIPAADVTTISLDFFFENASWLEVYKTGSETPLVLNTDYTVAGAGTSSGVVTLTTPANGSDAYSVYLIVPLERSSDMQLRGEFKSKPFNVELDRVWQAMQGIDTRLGRMLRVSRTSNVPTPLFSDTAAERSDRVLKFSGDGSGLEVGPTETQVENAQSHADAARQSAELAQEWAESPTPPGDPGTKSAKTHAESILNLTASATTVTNTDPATATYDPNTGNMDFEIPAGPKGDPGIGLGSVPSGTIVGRQTAGTGAGEYLTPSKARSVMGLGTAATTDVTAYATAAQGAKADAAIPATVLTTAGDILYRGAFGVERLPKGTVGQVLCQGASNAPEWKNQTFAPSAYWQDMSGSRVHSTSYQNTTGKPIMVAIRGSSGGDVEVSQNNSSWVRVGILGHPRSWEESVSFIVPNNYYYRAQGSFKIWSELR